MFYFFAPLLNVDISVYEQWCLFFCLQSLESGVQTFQTKNVMPI